MRKLATLATSVALLASVAVAKEIKVGAVMPMSGALAAYGQTTYEGIEFAHKLQPTLKNVHLVMDKKVKRVQVQVVDF